MGKNFFAVNDLVTLFDPQGESNLAHVICDFETESNSRVDLAVGRQHVTIAMTTLELKQIVERKMMQVLNLSSSLILKTCLRANQNKMME
mmetsp:Transcript_655/g.1519  ORF Transcript_655/g.1519 Transcript_655/m.1519 type:complete len:90 (+) Transcript_655:3375-3644(+)